jgi:succinoglycan biosynthesis protein ExoA
VTDLRATVIIPARNERHDIEGCIEALAGQTLPRNEMEVILVDGRSTDGTVDAALAAAQVRELDLTVLANEQRTAATSLNLGLQQARGDVVVRVDARSRVGRRHVELSCELLQDVQLGVVGGGQAAEARPGASLVERAIARSLTNRYTTGLARYRRSVHSGPTDTVWMGAFRRQDLVEVGGWPVFPEQNQDYRLNQRLRGSGLVVWFDPELTAGYLPRRTLRDLARQYLRFGRAKGAVWRAGERPSVRHLAVLSIPLVGLAALGWGCRRWGLVKAATTAVAACVVLDHVGVRRPASLPERGLAILAALTADGSWLLGVVLGLVDEP